MLTTVVKQIQYGEYTLLRLLAPKIAAQAKSGQFVEILAKGEAAPFWRRPFSICLAKYPYIEILIKPIGHGSTLISRHPKGSELDLIGPLGRGFTTKNVSSALLIGGGFGVAPLLFLASQLKQKGCSQIKLIFGGKCSTDLVLREEFKSLGINVECTTEDGSYGIKGRVTKLFNAVIPELDPQAYIACAGPLGMLRHLSEKLTLFPGRVEVCLESVMACGLGLCQGCVVETTYGYQRVCKEGPVFQNQDIIWT